MKKLEGYLSYNSEMKSFARMLRKEMTPAEQKLWKIIRGRSVENCRFLRQKPILSYIADFYCSELLLVIEIDGSSHDQKVELDFDRSQCLKEFGVTVIRYTNKQIMNELPRVLRHLKRVIRALKEDVS